jgi:hypothetical protein
MPSGNNFMTQDLAVRDLTKQSEELKLSTAPRIDSHTIAEIPPGFNTSKDNSAVSNTVSESKAVSFDNNDFPSLGGSLINKKVNSNVHMSTNKNQHTTNGKQVLNSQSNLINEQAIKSDIQKISEPPPGFTNETVSMSISINDVVPESKPVSFDPSDFPTLGGSKSNNKNKNQSNSLQDSNNEVKMPPKWVSIGGSSGNDSRSDMGTSAKVELSSSSSVSVFNDDDYPSLVSTSGKSTSITTNAAKPMSQSWGTALNKSDTSTSTANGTSNKKKNGKVDIQKLAYNLK